MTNEPAAIKEIHTIRAKIYEETRYMTPEERADFAHTEAQTLIKHYNLKLEYDEPALQNQ